MTFNIIIIHIFPESVIKIPKVVQKLPSLIRVKQIIVFNSVKLIHVTNKYKSLFHFSKSFTNITNGQSYSFVCQFYKLVPIW